MHRDVTSWRLLAGGRPNPLAHSVNRLRSSGAVAIERGPSPEPSRRPIPVPRAAGLGPPLALPCQWDQAECVKFDRDTITAELAAKECKRCGYIGAGTEFTFMDGPHFAKLYCNGCQAFIEWVSMPDVAPKRERRKNRKKLDDLGDRCEICLRHRDDLPSSQRLEVHHVLEVAADDGPDDLGNLRLYCSACHSMVSWIRTHFGHYHVVAPPSDDVDEVPA
jgi:hypothetical protein